MTENNVVSEALKLNNASYAQSKDFVEKLAREMAHGTFHHHFHIIWPLLEAVGGTTYLEIGCFAGASLITAWQCKTLQRAFAIDTFAVLPEQMRLVQKNLQDFATNNAHARTKLISGSSHDLKIVTQVYRAMLEDPAFLGIDLLFIDGDHSRKGVLQDYGYFEPLVRPGGLILFDDYADAKHSPQVRVAVDDIVKGFATQHNNFKVIGQPQNTVGAFGNGLKGVLSNEFIIQREQFSAVDQTKAKYIVCVATYCRSNGSSNRYMRNLLQNVQSQSIDNWFLIVVGDNYTNRAEFEDFKKLIPREKSVFINLPAAGERDDPAFVTKYGKKQLWLSGGTLAVNFGLMLCQRMRHDCVYVHADDDDSWNDDHLATLDSVYSAKADASFVWTMGHCGHSNKVLPSRHAPAKTGNVFVPEMPLRGQTLHSAVSWRVQHFPLRYRVAPNWPSDGDLWRRMAQHMRQKGLKSYLAKHITTNHPTENVQQ